ncbi:replication protein A 70 kDa DNA-binding subunit C-like isoform X2 [Arabidopsis lyrata subsp. lyrata]|uniref:replication protein A 70 kDa DNA-binding subunit C-like isoform X2 n=1 Tax=Arabidopsis lyrata subsp. lyrata TaxID=81972 RepID=UPI000A29C753|nr:replication protein A 70 kDa DNA-binding subunit C-like isoform X2 [Arabidopsis lyrata subsp. lyrata]|eukprot:XP_020870663.1 replication protein A 70 kDa DNA-binding subunit C-like isoform X2 [Arabidopsis lyrata subsp. lyrata]
MFEQNVSTFVFLDEIDPAAQRYKIKVQIVKLWRGFQKETGSAIEMVLIDEKGTRMHATVEDKLMNKFKSDLKEDQSILVDTFQLVNNGFEYKTSPHSFKISFFRTTSVTICDDFPNDVPEKYFVDFLKILAGVLDSKTLVDVIGHIVNIGPLEDIMIRGRSTTKLDVELRDTNDARLLCTFWGKYADQVSTYAAEHSADMIVCVVRKPEYF